MTSTNVIQPSLNKNNKRYLPCYIKKSVVIQPASKRRKQLQEADGSNKNKNAPSVTTAEASSFHRRTNHATLYHKISLIELRRSLYSFYIYWNTTYEALTAVAQPLYLTNANATVSRALCIDTVGKLCTRTRGKPQETRLGLVYCAAISYGDRLHLRWSSISETERKTRFQHIYQLEECERWILCYYMAEKLAADVSSYVSIAKFDKNLKRLSKCKCSVEFELLDLLDWRLEEPETNANRLLNLFIHLSGYNLSANITPATSQRHDDYIGRQCTWSGFALRLCLLSAYDPFLSSTNVNPTSLAVACFVLVAAAAGLEPWPRTLVTKLPNLAMRLCDLFLALERLLFLWDALSDLMDAPLLQPSLSSERPTLGHASSSSLIERWKNCSWLRYQVLLSQCPFRFRDHASSVSLPILVEYFSIQHFYSVIK